MAGIVAFDTNICVWGILNISDRDNMISRTRSLIQELHKDGSIIMISAPVLGELLTAVTPDKRPSLVAQLSKTVRIQPFDALSSLEYARMVYDYHHRTLPDSLATNQADGPIPRQVMKVDYMIAAIAKASGATCLYTEDRGLAKFANPHIDVRSVPNKFYTEPKSVLVQGSLFDQFESQQ